MKNGGARTELEDHNGLGLGALHWPRRMEPDDVGGIGRFRYQRLESVLRLGAVHGGPAISHILGTLF